MDDLVNRLENTLNDSLHIQDSRKSGGLKQHETKNTKCKTLPYTDMDLPPNSSDEEDFLEPISEDPGDKVYAYTPLTLKPSDLVSSMSDSRRKNGLPPKKTTVKWAEGVYEPALSFMEDFLVSVKKQQKSQNKKIERIAKIEKNEKKNAKKGQKGNALRGSGCKTRRIRSLEVEW